MSPQQAKTILEVMQELSSPQTCLPYVQELWGNTAQKTLSVSASEEAALVKNESHGNNYAEAIALTMREALAAKDTLGARAFLDDPEAAVLYMACQKRGLVLSNLAPIAPVIPLEVSAPNAVGTFLEANAQRPRYAIENTGDGRLTIDTNFLQHIADQYKAGGRSLGAPKSLPDKT